MANILSSRCGDHLFFLLILFNNVWIFECNTLSASAIADFDDACRIGTVVVAYSSELNPIGVKLSFRRMFRAMKCKDWRGISKEGFKIMFAETLMFS